MSLYLKYRPDSWEKIVGNTEVVSSIQNMLQKENHPHSYLLTGGTGCGKTTIARIMATELGCVGMDYNEVDSADFRGIDTVRDIRKGSQFKPMEGRCRVWVIDECHKMTNDAQNALLKILEDTPAHVYFILCTTDPQKLISTVKGRCSTFQVNPLTDKDMFRLLRKITTAEGDKLDKEIYDQIITDAMGHPRNAIQVLEQVLNVEPDLRLETARRKAEEQSEVIVLCRALLGKKSWKEIAGILTGLKQQDPENIRRVVIGYAQSVLLSGKTEDRCGLILEEFKEPTYNMGFPAVVLACYSITRN